MLRSLNSGVSGMQQFQESMDVIGNNIANVNTTGFKSARVDFEDTLSQTLRGSANGGALQIGTGVTTGGITNEFTQGGINNTGTSADLAMDGNGFFIVKDPTSGGLFATRAGDFHRDQSGYLVTSGGLRVQGNSVVDPTTGVFSSIGDLKIDNTTNAPAQVITDGASVSNFSVDTTGRIQVTYTDGAQAYVGQVLLDNYSNPDALIKEGSNLYSGVDNAAAGGFGSTNLQAAQSKGLGKILGGALESSNVDLANEFANMITTQRAFQANARVITTSDEILQELVNLKH